MASENMVEAPLATSVVLMAASNHISTNCRAENKAFLHCKKTDSNPEKCLSYGHEVTRCVFSLLRELRGKCPKEMDSYSGCMNYYGNEFELCRREQKQFECACPLNE